MSTDGSEVLDAAYWAETCQGVPADATMVLIKMGSVVDYYRPNEGVTFCEMFTSEAVNHQFSRDGSQWVTPSDYGGHFGGSNANDVPDDPDDSRTYLTFWGSSGPAGGCCHSSYSDGAAWGQAFEVIYHAELPVFFRAAHPLSACLPRMSRAACPACLPSHACSSISPCLPSVLQLLLALAL